MSKSQTFRMFYPVHYISCKIIWFYVFFFLFCQDLSMICKLKTMDEVQVHK